MTTDADKNKKNMSRRKFIAAGAGVVVVAAASAYYLSQPAPSVTTPQTTAASSATSVATAGPKKGGVLKIAFRLPGANMDPHFGAVAGDVYQQLQNYDFILQRDKQLNLIPGVAEKWEVAPDGTSLTFYLRKGVMLHTGREATSDDLKFSFERGKVTGVAKTVLSAVDHVEIVDKYTAKVILSYPSVAVLGAMGDPSSRSGFLVPNPSDADLAKVGISRADFQNQGFQNFELGTGPFVLISRKRGELEVYKRFEQYWQKDANGIQLPYVDELDVVPPADPSQRVQLLRAGSVDVAMNMNLSDVDALKKEANFEVFQGPSTVWSHISFNFTSSPFKDQRLRQAVAYAVNKQEVVDVVTSGKGEVLNSPLSSAYPWHIDVPTFQYNPDKAKQLMKDAGYGDGITGMLAAFHGNDDLAKVVQKQLQAVGINLDLNIQDVTVWIQLVQSQKQTLTVHSWNGKYDPIVNFNLSLGAGGTYDSEGAKWRSLAAGGTPDNLVATIDDLLHRANSEFDPDKRKQLAAQIQTASVNLGLCVPLIGWPQAHGYAKNIKNLYVEPEAYATNNSTIWLG